MVLKIIIANILATFARIFKRLAGLIAKNPGIVANIFKWLGGLIAKITAIIFKRLKGPAAKLNATATSRNEKQVEEAELTLISSIKVSSACSTCFSRNKKQVEEAELTFTDEIKKTNYGRFFCPRMTKKERKKGGPYPWSKDDFLFVLDEVLCNKEQTLMVKNLFLQHFDIRFRYASGFWISFRPKSDLNLISHWYNRHTYPSLEIMVKYANEELKIMREKARSDLDNILI